MRIIVQKYGGTSVNTPQKRIVIAEKAKDVLSQGAFPVIVVSAMGRHPSPYATDSLFELIDKTTADERSKDMLIACGEIISAVVVSEALKEQGLEGYPLTGERAGILTQGEFGQADIASIDPSRITALLKEGKIPVVAGFQGQNASGEMQTLGRGGSDTTAAALGEYLKAEAIEIYTDVSGVMSADPNCVANPVLLEKLNYDDVFLMAEAGAKVIHPRAVTHAKRGNVALCVMNTTLPRESPHTVIAREATEIKGEYIAVTSKETSEKSAVITILAVKEEPALVAKVLSVIEKKAIAHEDFKIDGKSITFETPADKAKTVVALLHKELVG